MTAEIIDGKATAAELRQKVAEVGAEFRQKTGRAPGLAVVLVGEHPPSAAYVRSKAKATREALPFVGRANLSTKISELGFFRGRGCDECGGTGLKGRQGVYEVLTMTPLIRKMVMMNNSAAELRDAAIEEGMLTLRMDAWLKVMKGITTTEQMIRETSA